MTGPLSVRVRDSAGGDRHPRFSGLRFTWSAYGGPVEAAATLTAPLTDFHDLGPNAPLTVYDTGTGEALFEGFLTIPGQTSGRAGQSFEVKVAGVGTLASDSSRPYILVTNDLGGWQRYRTSKPNATTGTDEDPTTAEPCLQVSADEGKTVGTTWWGDWANETLADAGMILGRIRARALAGVTTGWQMSIRTKPSAVVFGDGTARRTITAPATQAWLISERGGSNPITDGDDVPILRAARSGSATTGVEAAWFDFSEIYLTAERLGIDGTRIQTGYGTSAVLPHQVVADMVGRGMLPMVDVDRCVIDESTAEIWQLASPEGISGSSVLDMLQLWESDFHWGYGPSGSVSGYPFWYRRWDDTNPVYELDDATDQVQIEGSGDDLCNRIVVGYTDAQGRARTETVTSVVPALGSRVRDAEPLTLPAGYGTQLDAQLIGTQLLASKAHPHWPARQ